MLMYNSLCTSIELSIFLLVCGAFSYMLMILLNLIILLKFTEITYTDVLMKTIFAI